MGWPTPPKIEATHFCFATCELKRFFPSESVPREPLSPISSAYHQLTSIFGARNA
jgi:hypothetical protein